MSEEDCDVDWKLRNEEVEFDEDIDRESKMKDNEERPDLYRDN